MEEVVAAVRDLAGVLVVRPGPGSELPELTWGDVFLYYAPDGRMPRNVQPYATVVTKNYPGDLASGLDAPGRLRVNIQVGRTTFRELTGEEPRSLARPRDHAATDLLMPHPVYGTAGWIAVVNPGPRTGGLVVRLLREAHEAARARYARRNGESGQSGQGRGQEE
ncbi:DUF6194 family protein [Streptomyces sp. NPDC004111]|uniref:DUF6194 family protein n=1 Tax=Streptomyces sp. NPDC004111 TaxID=3364690 RepID=UPI0036A0F602